VAHALTPTELPPPIDWQAPWFAPLRALGEGAAAAWAGGLPVHAALNSALSAAGDAAPNAAPADASLAPVRFVPQAALPDGVAYEAYLFAQRQCPTRDNLHDFFNGLCWLAWPRTKRRINALQAAQIARDGVRATRGPVRDALTLLDENGALLLAPAALWDALRARDWQRLFVQQRSQWQDARLLIIGHALLEKLVRPRKDLTAHVWCATLRPGDAAWREAQLDAVLAESLTEPVLAAKPFVPLPVMGVPGWCADNAHAAYYSDVAVFRPAPAARPPE